jgi:nucleotide-binding universal stress UspA family protein
MDNIMIKLDRILVPTDFSDNGQCAVKYAVALAEKFNAELHLLHVLQDMLPASSTGEGLIFASAGDFVQEFRNSAKKALADLTASDAFKGKKVVSVIREGQPFVEIIRYAREELADLIIVATHGRTGLAHVLMGSVAERVVRKAGCPVLTVRPVGHQFVMP